MHEMDFQSSNEVLAAITSIFPEFAVEWERDNPYITDGKFSIHSVYMAFLPFLASAEKTEKNLRMVASLINGAVSAGGGSENAVSTCVLEHAHQVGLTSALKPYLSKEAKERLHA
jgi:hypothetical protein